MMKRNSFFLGLLATAIAVKAQKTISITFNHADKIVYGCVTIPDGTGPFPAIVIAPGSGPNDRDGMVTLSGGNAACLYPGLNGSVLRPYKDLGDALAGAGFVVLRYNKLEYNYPGNLGTITFDKLWLPFASAIDYVRKRPEVDSNVVVLVGHSEGSSLIPIVAAGRPYVRALVSLAGARTPFDSILCRQIVDFTQICGGSIVQAQAQANAIHAYYGDLRSGNWNASTPDLFGVPASVWNDYVQATDPVVQNYDACNRPTLFLGMGDDLNVPPAELTRFQNEISVPADFWSIPGTNHFMTYSATPTVAKAVPDTIIYWLKKKLVFTALQETAPVRWKLSPNPSGGVIRISGLVKPTEAIIFNTLGSAVKQVKLSAGDNQVDVSDLPAGVYFLRDVSSPLAPAHRFLRW